MKDFKHINEAVLNNDFSLFNQLNEDDQKQVQKTWNQTMWLNYMSQEPTISDDDLFNELYKIIDNSEK